MLRLRGSFFAFFVLFRGCKTRNEIAAIPRLREKIVCRGKRLFWRRFSALSWTAALTWTRLQHPAAAGLALCGLCVFASLRFMPFGWGEAALGLCV